MTPTPTGETRLASQADCTSRVTDPGKSLRAGWYFLWLIVAERSPSSIDRESGLLQRSGAESGSPRDPASLRGDNAAHHHFQLELGIDARFLSHRMKPIAGHLVVVVGV